MKALSRKCTAFLLSLTLLLTLAPTALASEALGDDLDLRSTTLNRGAELGEGTFWSNTFSDLFGQIADVLLQLVGLAHALLHQIGRIVGDGNRTVDPHVGAQQKTGQGNDDEYRDTTP